MQAKAKVARILLVDDHPIVRRGLADLIEEERDMEVCGQARSADEARRAVRQLQPDLAVVDLSLGDDSGLELLKDIQTIDESVKLLVVSIHDESIYAERVLKAGALGYVNKRAAEEHLVDAVRRVLKGNIYLEAQIADRMLRQMMNGAEEPGHDPHDRLSDREMEVYRLLGEGVSTRQIAERLHLSVKTIESYREHIKTKLNLRDSSEMIRHAVQWVLEQR